MYTEVNVRKYDAHHNAKDHRYNEQALIPIVILNSSVMSLEWDQINTCTMKLK